MTKKLLITCILLGTGLGVGLYLGHRIGEAEAFHKFVGIQHHKERRSYAIRYALGLEQFQGITGQDLWVLHSVHPDVTDGFFVDVGSADGVAISNTWELERNGWSGICIDPFPRNMDSRTCEVVDKPVDTVGGRTVEFQNPGSFKGGIVEYAGSWISDEAKKEAVKVKTTTLADVLRRADAPSYIHYLNVDIEGAEYNALRDFPFEDYTFGAISIEHNNKEGHRARIRNLLVQNGYRLEWAIRDQDWYVPVDRKPNSS